MTHLIETVEAMYPRIDKTYHFDQSENKSVPCPPTADGAVYEMSFRMTKEQAKELFTVMSTAYQEKRQDKWPEKISNPFKKDDDGMYVGKAKLKGAYGDDKTKKPMQCDAKANELPEDFKLTTGSTVNVAVVLSPYSEAMGSGVSLRLKAVQVVKLAEARGAANPFGVVDGYDSKEGNPFTAVAEPEPKVVKKKSTPDPQDKQDLGSIVDDWDDE